VLTVFGPYALAVGLSLWLNRLDATDCRGRRFDLLTDGTPLVLVTLLYSATLLLTGRSLFSGLLVMGGALLLFAVNRLKLSQFKEPLVFVDFGLFAQMIRHPRFYLPFIFPLPVVCTVVLLAVVMGLLYRAQSPLAPGDWRPWALFYAALLPSLLVLIRFSPAGGRWVESLLAGRAPSFDPNTDFARFGLTGSLLLHSLAHAHRPGKDGKDGPMPSDAPSPKCVWSAEALDPLSGEKPHIVLVQAESFFDFRRADPGVDPSIYTEFDRLRTAGESGQMVVSAHGAYTMRTEFSVLTGIPNRALESDAMNPYWTASGRPVWSLAKHLSAQGYRTVCVHPYDLQFFRRDRVMPNLGFDELHGEALFSGAKRTGPYVSDDALAAYILELLANSKEPVFVFAISMEAHGPWSGGRFSDMEVPPDLVAPPGWGGLELTAYLTHLRNTDRMLGRLAAQAGTGERPLVLGAYGDHVGCVPDGRLKDSNTDYLVWPGAGKTRTIRAEDLGGMLLQHAACPMKME
jgi:hypothetical protein